jgi:hypothetical protein
VSDLERRAEEWIAPYWNAEHLRRARDWLVELEPAADEAARLAALTHDMERHFPGGPSVSLEDPAGEALYRDEHSRRSAEIVGAWLRAEGADDELARRVGELVLLHETGGTPEADLVQAADSLSFLEVNPALVESWVRDGRCSRERGAEQLRWMFDRMRVERARELGRPLLEDAVARV